MKNQRYFRVGERAKDDSKTIPIFGITLEPKSQSKGNILFLEGFSGNYEDYLSFFLRPLSEAFRVDAYNYRSHIGSHGRFNNDSNLDDAQTILEEIPGDVFVVAHSYGAYLAARLDSDKVKGVYCIEPVFDPQMLSTLPRLGVNAANTAGYVPGLLQVMDAFLNKTWLNERLGFKVVSPLQGLRELARTSASDCSKPMAFTLASEDRTLGSHQQSRYLALIDMVRAAYPHAKNRSEVAEGLNHCLNLKGFEPFLKPEKNKDSDKILEDIVDFCSE